MKQRQTVNQRPMGPERATPDKAPALSQRSGKAPRAGQRSGGATDVSPNRRRASTRSRAEQLLLFGDAARDEAGGRQRQVSRKSAPDIATRDRAARAKAVSPQWAPDRPYESGATVVVNTPTCSPARARRLADRLQSLVDLPLRLRIHDNRSTMVSFRRETEALHLRVHHMFLDADREVLQAIADYSQFRDRAAGSILDRYVRANRDRIRPMDVEQLRSRPLQTQGEVHDLADIYDGLNARYFGKGVDARIGWGRGSTNRRRRSIRMGAYYHDTRTILIHPALDRVEVPRYFVEFVVYHEMLHQAVPQHRTPSGRRCVHTPEFRAREKLFHDYDRARAWEDRNLNLLLRPKSSRSRFGSR